MAVTATGNSQSGALVAMGHVFTALAESDQQVAAVKQEKQEAAQKTLAELETSSASLETDSRRLRQEIITQKAVSEQFNQTFQAKKDAHATGIDNQLERGNELRALKASYLSRAAAAEAECKTI